MKKLILSVTAIAGMSLASYGQGITFADNSGATYDTTINGAANTTQDLNLELLYGTSAGNVTTPIVTLLLNAVGTPTPGVPTAIGGVYNGVTDISFLGTIADPSGTTYTLPGGVTDYFQVLAWTGSSTTYPGATPGATDGASAIFTESIPAGSTAFPADVSNVGVVGLVTNVVPEPSTLAMAGVGLASMLIFRRKNS
jgi:hypothetical protein